MPYFANFIMFWHNHFDITRPLFRTVTKTYSAKLQSLCGSKREPKKIVKNENQILSQGNRMLTQSFLHSMTSFRTIEKKKQEKWSNLRHLNVQAWYVHLFEQTIRKILRKRHSMKKCQVINIVYVGEHFCINILNTFFQDSRLF